MHLSTIRTLLNELTSSKNLKQIIKNTYSVVFGAHVIYQ